MDTERSPNRALVDEVERFVRAEQRRLARDGIDTGFQRSPDDWPKVSATIAVHRLPYATADLSVWDTGEAELEAAWGQGVDRWDEILQEHLELVSPDEVRNALNRMVELVRRDRPRS